VTTSRTNPSDCCDAQVAKASTTLERPWFLARNLVAFTLEKFFLQKNAAAKLALATQDKSTQFHSANSLAVTRNVGLSIIWLCFNLVKLTSKNF